jgi:hypothetical protein
MSFIVALASDTPVFSLRRNKGGAESTLHAASVSATRENRPGAAIYALPSHVCLAHGSIQTAHEIFRSAVFSSFQ